MMIKLPDLVFLDLYDYECNGEQVGGCQRRAHSVVSSPHLHFVLVLIDNGRIPETEEEDG